MFVVHDRTRRYLCRVIFLALCVAPTVCILSGIVVVRSSIYQAAECRAWEQRLAEQLGLSVSLQAVRSPTQGVTLLEHVVLKDPETDEVIARVRQLEMGHNGRQFIVLAAQPEIQGSQVWRLWEVLHDRILRSQQARSLQAQLFAGEITLFHADGQSASTLTDFRCRLSPTADGPQAAIEFRDVALQTAEPTQLRITRQQAGGQLTTRWELHTRSAALPCTLLAEHVPQLACLGERATFQGTVEMMRTEQGWQGDVIGHFRDVELDRLVTDRFDHKLSGDAEIVFRRARLLDGKLIDAAGEVISHGGVVSWSLLDQAHKSLGLVADARIRASDVDKYMRYRELRFGFSMNADGLAIVGHCSSAAQGVVMSDQIGPLLSDRPQEVAQVVALVRALSSSTGEQVPATAEAAQLLHVLPIPSGQATASLSDAREIHTPVRLRDSGVER